ncbi:MAG: ribose ABC transporter permease [Firmicutes bacterium HGW-Firmicutes-16]|nr:MAG: ribose ABC transporter permease [Firmicutes bacterium HGW-Firmicutes-16]
MDAAKKNKIKFEMKGNLSILMGLVVLCIFFSIASSKFLSASNFINILLQVSNVGIVAIGGMFVILTGGIDLSSGSMSAILGLFMAGFCVDNGFPVPIAIVLGIIMGIVLGFVNGLSVTRLRMSPFIVTLAMQSMLRGLGNVYSMGTTISGMPDSFNFIGGGKLWGIPFPVILLIFLFILAHYVLSKTVFGHQVYAVGGNREAAYLAGINVKRIELTTYLIAGGLTAVAALVLTGRLAAALPTAAVGLEFSAISAIVIGGGSLSGGKGNMFGTLIGVLIIGVLNNGLNLLNISPFWSQFAQGFIIFIAVLIDALNLRRIQDKA